MRAILMSESLIPAPIEKTFTRQSGLRAAALALGILLGACGAEEARQEPPESAPTSSGNVLLNPDDPAFDAEAPDTFRVRFETSKGDFVVQVVKAWAPIGANRFYNLVRNGFYDDARFFRAIQGFMVQFGLNGDPAVDSAWATRGLRDDPVAQSNLRSYVTFAMRGQPNTRTTQLFINLADNANLDGMGFAPFGMVVEGMEVVDQLYTGYGEGAPNGSGPAQDQIRAQGNAYLQRDFSQLDYVERATIES
jgi:peptidyl-prolyl cis-trans isomerase A (cyclophilin A)